MKYEFINEEQIEIIISENGYYPISITSSSECSIKLKIDKGIDATMFIAYHGTVAQSDVDLHVEENAKVKILMWDEMKESLHGTHKIDVYKDAKITLGYGFIDHGSNDIDITCNLLQEGAQMHLLSSSVCATKKHIRMNCIHHVPNTISNMENHSVVKEHGDYFMEATGTIVKGAFQSVSHQKTHVLTMSEDQRSEVIPLLLIDEYDVKASHATTMGQPDENQLYYLQTRGLSRDRALALLTVGYIMPITELIENDELKEKLKEDIEKKAGV